MYNTTKYIPHINLYVTWHTLYHSSFYLTQGTPHITGHTMYNTSPCAPHVTLYTKRHNMYKTSIYI